MFHCIYVWFLRWLKSLCCFFFINIIHTVAAVVYQKYKKNTIFIYIGISVQTYIIIIDCNNFIIFGPVTYWQRPVDISAEFKKIQFLLHIQLLTFWVKGGTFIFWTFRKFLCTNQAQEKKKIFNKISLIALFINDVIKHWLYIRWICEICKIYQ